MLRGIIVLALILGVALAGPVLAPAAAAQQQPAPAPAASPAALNLNTATAEQLDRLPGVGPALASRILEYRQKNGGFKKVEELMNIKGIGEKNFLKLKPLVTVLPAKTTPVSEPAR